jgi:asparagine synthase (glutamine-hydrolysing)
VTTRVAEPLADAAILPTFLLARTAREHVKVILSGEGADELFGGYPRHIGHKIAPKYDALPSFLRSGLRKLAFALPPSGKKVTLEYLLKRFVTDAETSMDRAPPALVRHGPRRASAGRAVERRRCTDGRMLLDYRSYLRDNLLVKVDRATMLSSVKRARRISIAR